MVRFGVLDTPLTYITLAATGPAISLSEVQSIPMTDATSTSVMFALGFTIWKLINQSTKFLEHAEEHRKLQVAEWSAEAEHRAAQVRHWAED